MMKAKKTLEELEQKRITTAKFVGRCRNCSCSIDVGQRIQLDGDVWVHADEGDVRCIDQIGQDAAMDVYLANGGDPDPFAWGGSGD